MNQQTSRMFTLQEAAIAYALSAEKICDSSTDFLNENPSVVPVFVNLLFQSLEISIKAAGIESNLFTIGEARSRQNRSGHGISELAALAVEKLGGDPFEPTIMAMTFANTHSDSNRVIREMICGEGFQRTRDSYATRNLGYGEVAEGDFAIMEPIASWIVSVKETAQNLPQTIEILSQWKQSSSSSKHFAIWLNDRE